MSLRTGATHDTDDARHRLEQVATSPSDSGLSDVAEAAIDKIGAGEAEDAEHIVEHALEESGHSHWRTLARQTKALVCSRSDQAEATVKQTPPALPCTTCTLAFI